jgi:hypothetical protein
VLSVKGVVCSGISYSSGSFSKETLQKRQQLAKVMLQCLERIERLGLRKAAYTNWDDTILTFMCGIDHRNQQAVVNDDLIVKYDAFITWCQSANDWPGTDEEDDSGYPEYWYNLWRLMNRRFFITESGLLGMAPMKTRLGDYVCVISGSHVPFVLRKQGTRWKLIGDAYCRRLMAVS